MTAQLRSISGTPRLLYRLNDAAAQLSISRTKLYGLLRTGAMPSVLLGGTRLIAHDDLVAYVNGLRAKAEPYADTAS